MAYTAKKWETGNVIDADSLNHIEQGIAEGGTQGYSFWAATAAVTESKLTKEQLPNSGAGVKTDDFVVDINGDVYHITAVGDSDVTVGSKLFSLKGPQGAAGAKGDTGAAGAKGDTGVGVASIALTKDVNGAITAGTWTDTAQASHAITITTASSGS